MAFTSPPENNRIVGTAGPGGALERVSTFGAIQLEHYTTHCVSRNTVCAFYGVANLSLRVSFFL